MSNSRTLIEARKLAIGYNPSDPLIEDANFILKGPALVQILGPNGAGKTTLLRTILGLLKPIRGRIIVNGIDVTGQPELAGPLMGYVPQLSTQKEHYPVTVWEAVAMLLTLYKYKWPRLRLREEDMKRVEEVLQRVGLDKTKWHESLWRLSGGERQRVLIARALVYDPPILLMDEPFSAVDPQGKAELARFIADLAKEKLILVTSHDPMLLIDRTDIVILMNKGLFIIGEPSKVLTLENTRKIYGEAARPVIQHIHISDHHVVGA